MPCRPSTATTISNPFLLRRRESMSRFISLSSTSRIFGIITLFCRKANGSRYADREYRAGAGLALDLDVSTHHEAEPLGDRESQPGAAILACGRGFGLRKGFEQSSHLLR